MRYGRIVALLLGVAGCGEAKPRPINVAPPVPEDVAPAPSAELPTVKDRPAASDPAAAELAGKALAAHTDNKPGEVTKFKTVEFVRVGLGKSAGDLPVKLTWEVAAGWPDKFRVRVEFPNQQAAVVARSGKAGWRAGAGLPVPMTAAEVAELQIDSTGEWMCFLFPLADPATVLAPAAAATVNGKACPGVKVWHPLLAPAVVHFDPDTKLLVRVTFEGREAGRPGVKEFDILETKAYAGVKLAQRMAQKVDGRQYADWTLTKVDPKAALDPKLFDAGR